MKKFRNLVKEYFNISEKEANGFVGLTIFMVFVLSFPWIYKYYQEKNLTEDSFIQADQSFFSELQKTHEVSEKFYSPKSISNFNPNKIGVKEWKKLGVRNEIAHRIEKYKAKGGRFKVKSDLLKIYGFSEEMYFKLNEYILLPDSLAKKSIPASDKEQVLKIYINEAEARELELVNGIGPVLSKRIVKFRDALGGFVKKEQLYEVYGLDSSVALELINQSTIPKGFKPLTVNLNADYKTIASHPYIGWKAARVLKAYNKEHGIKSTEDLAKSKAFTQEELKKVTPYLKLKPLVKDTTELKK